MSNNTKLVPLNHVRPTLVQRDTLKRMVDITLAHAALVRLRSLDLNKKNPIQDFLIDLKASNFVNSLFLHKCNMC